MGAANNPPPEYAWCVGCAALGGHSTQSSPGAYIADKGCGMPVGFGKLAEGE
jgi:hypothetical protein